MARRALGRGLGALISGKKAESVPVVEDNNENPAGGVVHLPLEKLIASPWQPRKTFDEEKLHNLADSIREQGLVQPVVVRKVGEKYELIAGERRYRAVQSLGEKSIPAVIMEASDAKMRELALVENLQRDDLNPIEIAYAYEALREELGLKHEEIARHIGVSRVNITNTLRLLELPEEIKNLVSEKQISAGHARAILALPDGLSQIRLAKKIAAEGLSVREAERIVSGDKGKKSSGTKGSAAEPAKMKDNNVRDVEDRMRAHLGTKVSIVDKKGKGTITIEYYTPGDVARILDKMGIPSDPS